MNHSIQKTHMLHHAHSNENYEVLAGLSDDICFDIRNYNDLLQFLLFLVGNSAFLTFLFPNISIITVTVTTSGLLTFNIFIWNMANKYRRGSGRLICISYFGNQGRKNRKSHTSFKASVS